MTTPAAKLAAARLGTTGGIVALAAGVVGTAFAGGVSSGLIGALAGPDPYKGDAAQFPEELLENDHWIEFTAKQTRGVAESVLADVFGSIGSTTLGGTIRLPMPSNLSTDYNPEYSTPDLGAAAGMALKPSDQAIYNNNTMGNQALIGNGMQGLITAAGAGAVGAATALGLSTVSGALGSEQAGAALLKVGAGVAINPHKIVLFTGVGLRDHSFSWKLSPKTREESNAIRKIINMFTYYSHPEYVAGGLFLKYPEFFTIKFRHPNYLFNLQPSVCTDVRVNYHGQGYPAYIRDADGGGDPAPAEIELSLTFKETEIVTKQSLNPSIDVTNNQATRGMPLFNVAPGDKEDRDRAWEAQGRRWRR